MFTFFAPAYIKEAELVLKNARKLLHYKKDVLPGLVAPLQALRTWAFTFAFLSIGLTTRVREFASVGARPFYAFSMGVAVNVVLGFVLSTQVFSEFWSRLGQ